MSRWKPWRQSKAIRKTIRPSSSLPNSDAPIHTGDGSPTFSGYLGAVDPEELDSDPAYHPEDWVGRAGLERSYEKALRGTPGVAVERTDRSGRILST